MLMVIEPTRLCTNPECPKAGQRQPWSAFYAKAKWPDGSMRRPHSQCKVCMLAKGNDPATSSRARLRVVEDPERLQVKRTRDRDAQRRRRGTPPERYRPCPTVPSEAPVDLAALRKTLVPAQPFAEWATAKLATGFSRRELAGLLGISPRTLYAIVSGERPSVCLTTVEGALDNWGDPGLFGRLYPDVLQ